MLYQVHIALAGIELTTLVVVGTDYIGSCKIQQPHDHDHDAPKNKNKQPYPPQKKQQQKKKEKHWFKILSTVISFSKIIILHD